MRDLVAEVRSVAAEIERITSRYIGDSDLTEQLPSVLAAVMNQWKVTREELLGPRRTKRIVEARFACWLLLYEIPGSSFPKIGRAFSGRNHSSIRYGIEQIKTWSQSNQEIREKINGCRKNL